MKTVFRGAGGGPLRRTLQSGSITLCTMGPSDKSTLMSWSSAPDVSHRRPKSDTETKVLQKEGGEGGGGVDKHSPSVSGRGCSSTTMERM
jgi:hypothetical protein